MCTQCSHMENVANASPIAAHHCFSRLLVTCRLETQLSVGLDYFITISLLRL